MDWSSLSATRSRGAWELLGQWFRIERHHADYSGTSTIEGLRVLECCAILFVNPDVHMVDLEKLQS
jgi:hypothetical protein